MLDFSLRGVPVLFEICNQCRAEMTVGLLTTIDSHIAAENIERLLADAEGAPVAGGADHARRREIVTHLDDGLLDLIRRRNHIANHATLGAVAFEAAAHHDRLARRAGAHETRQT